MRHVFGMVHVESLKHLAMYGKCTTLFQMECLVDFWPSSLDEIPNSETFIELCRLNDKKGIIRHVKKDESIFECPNEESTSDKHQKDEASSTAETPETPESVSSVKLMIALRRHGVNSTDLFFHLRVPFQTRHDINMSTRSMDSKFTDCLVYMDENLQENMTLSNVLNCCKKTSDCRRIKKRLAMTNTRCSTSIRFMLHVACCLS